MVGVLIAAGVVDESNAGDFGAKQAWLYVTILTVGYMVSRGLATATATVRAVCCSSAVARR